MVGGQGEDSCGNSGTDETPQERKRRGGDEEAYRPPAESEALHGKQQRSSKQSRSCIQIVRLWGRFISVCPASFFMMLFLEFVRCDFYLKFCGSGN
ncbi:hypothetical protein KM918_10725 [Priestia megaterium]|nr:hypothetical protein [Priestia megaterium]